MANIFRGPLVVGRRDPPIQNNATLIVGPSLLATTLAIAAAIPLPLGAAHLGPPTQGHNSAPRNFVNADTSRGTPKTLIADSKTAQFLTPQLAPQLHGRNEFLNADTSRGTPKSLYADATTPANNRTASAPAVLRLGADTSQDIPTALFALTAAPLVNSPASFGAHWVRRLEIRGDSSQGTPKALTIDGSAPLFNAPYLTTDRIKPVADTSLSSPLALVTPVVVTTSVTRGPLIVGRRDMPVQRAVDTSRSTPVTLFPGAVVAPRVNAPGYTVDWAQKIALGADTSKGIPKAFLLDDVASAQMGEALPLVPFPHKQTDTSQGQSLALRAPVVLPPFINAPQITIARRSESGETSRFAPKTLFADTTFPVQNAPGAAAPSPARIGSETTQGMPLGLRGIVAVPIVNLPQYGIDWARAVSNTSAGTPKSLTTDAQTPVLNAAQAQVDRLRVVAGTSTQSRALLDVAIPPPPVVNAPQSAPDRQRQSSDTTQGTPSVLRIVAIAPFVNAPQYAVDWQRAASNTGTGTAKTLIADSIAPLFNPPHLTADRIRPVTDTTSFRAKSLYGDSTTPVLNVPHRAPDRARWFHVDASLNTSTPLITAAGVFNLGNTECWLVDPMNRVVHVDRRTRVTLVTYRGRVWRVEEH